MARLAAGFAAGVLLERNGYVPYVQRVGSPYWADWVQPNLDAIAKEISSRRDSMLRPRRLWAHIFSGLSNWRE